MTKTQTNFRHGLSAIVIVGAIALCGCSKNSDASTAPPPKVVPLDDSQRANNQKGFLKRFHVAPGGAAPGTTAPPAGN